MNVNKFGALLNKFIGSTFSQVAQDVAIKTLTATPDGQGGFTEAWNTAETVKGFLIQQNGLETEQGGRLQAESVFKVYISKTTIDEKAKLTINGEDFNIVTINNVATADQMLIIECKKGVAQ